MEKFNNFIHDFVMDNITIDIAYYIMFALFLVSFIIPLLGMAGSKSKFKSGARYIINKSTPETIDGDVSRLPRRLALLYKKARRVGAMPSDLITLDTAVNVPFFSSFIKNLSVLTLTNSLLIALFSYCLTHDYTIVLVSILIGMILSLISAIISKSYYAKATRIYFKLIEKLDNFALWEEDSDPIVFPTSKELFEENKTANEQTQKANETVQENSNVDKGMPGGANADKGMPGGAIDKTENQESDDKLYQTSFFVDMEKPVSQMNNDVPPQQIPEYESTQAKKNYNDEDLLPSTEDIIEKVETIAQTGGSISMMKDVATQLQLERAKPENRSPSKQKKLNEALASLLKSISNATNH